MSNVKNPRWFSPEQVGITSVTVSGDLVVTGHRLGNGGAVESNATEVLAGSNPQMLLRFPGDMRRRVTGRTSHRVSFGGQDFDMLGPKAGKPIAIFHGDASFSSCTFLPDDRTIAVGDFWGGAHFLRLDGNV
jgi:hypothetical protein